MKPRTYAELAQPRTFGNTVAPHITPRAVGAFMRYFKDKEELTHETQVKGRRKKVLEIPRRKLREALAWSGAKVLAAAAFYNYTANLYGVSARDNGLSFDAGKAWGNASGVSLTVATGIASAIPAHWQDTVASAIIPVEWAASVVRMIVEQKVWRKYGFTSDPMGVLLTPVLAGTFEFAYKCTVNYPQDTQGRLVVGLTGIYGNLVRIAHAGLIALAGAGLKNAGFLKNSMYSATA